MERCPTTDSVSGLGRLWKLTLISINSSACFKFHYALDASTTRSPVNQAFRFYLHKHFFPFLSFLECAYVILKSRNKEQSLPPRLHLPSTITVLLF